MDENDSEYMQVKFDGKFVGQIKRTGDQIKDANAASQLLADLGVRPGPPTEFEAMVNQAASFAEAAVLINAELLQKERRLAGVSTFVVNAAFAMEVYLKALTLRYGGKVNRKLHGLSELLHALPPDADIAVKWSIPFVIPKDGLAEAWDLAEILRVLNNAFIEWRYLYEKSGQRLQVHVPQTIYAMRVLHRACFVDAAKASADRLGG